jgi:hypothetical protein
MTLRRHRAHAPSHRAGDRPVPAQRRPGHRAEPRTATAAPAPRRTERSGHAAAPDHGRRHLGTALALVAGLLGSGALVWQGTSAVFSSTTANSGNSWTLGSVTLADDDSSSALFAVPSMVPGDNGENCITVSYTGDVAATVTLYASASADASSVAQYVDLVVEEGSGGGFGDCTGFVAGGAPIYSGTLANFTSTKTNHGNGVGSWAPTGTASTVYRIGYTLNAATPSNKQGSVTTVTFQWESQS